METRTIPPPCGDSSTACTGASGRGRGHRPDLAGLPASDVAAPDNAFRGGARLSILAYILTGLAALIMVFLLLREGKRIGVLRLLGHSAARIWYRIVGRLQLASVLLATLACVAVAFLIPGGGAALATALAPALIVVAATGFVAVTAVGLIIISRVQISELIKGRLQ